MTSIGNHCHRNTIAHSLTFATNLLCTCQTSLCDLGIQHGCDSLDAASDSVLVLNARSEIQSMATQNQVHSVQADGLVTSVIREW